MSPFSSYKMHEPEKKYAKKISKKKSQKNLENPNSFLIKDSIT